MDIVNKSLCNNVFRKVLGILKPFANFAKGEFAPSASEDAFKKGLSGVQGQSPCNLSPLYVPPKKTAPDVSGAVKRIYFPVTRNVLPSLGALVMLTTKATESVPSSSA